jgi:hypothetical protein
MIDKFSKALSVISNRPFNMKGQEIEEIFAYLLEESLRTHFNF